MTIADRVTIVIAVALGLAWLNLFRLSLKDRRYQPKHRLVPKHRA